MIIPMGKHREDTARKIAAKQTRQTLIDAAAFLLKEKAFDQISVDDIVALANVSKGTFYTYFERKEDIISEIAFARFSAIEQQAVRGNSIQERIKNYLTESMQYIISCELNVCRQWITNCVECGNSDGSHKYDYDLNIIRRMLVTAVENKELSQSTPIDFLADSIVCAYYGAVMKWAMYDGTIDPLKLLQEECALVWDPLLRSFQRSAE